MITNIKPHTDKNNHKMAFIDIEDITGKGDAIVFSSSYDQVAENLIEDTPVIIWGKADVKDDKQQIIVDFIEPVDKIKMVLINLTPEEAIDAQQQQKLKSILPEQSGDKSRAKVPTMAIVNGDTERIFVRFGDNYWVQSAEDTTQALENAGFSAYVKSLI